MLPQSIRLHPVLDQYNNALDYRQFLQIMIFHYLSVKQRHQIQVLLQYEFQLHDHIDERPNVYLQCLGKIVVLTEYQIKILDFLILVKKIEDLERYFGFDFFLSIKGPRATKSAGSNATVLSPFLTCIILSFFHFTNNRTLNSKFITNLFDF